MGQIKDITNQQFSRLRVLYFAGVRNNKARWVCLCVCGNQIETQGKQLRLGHTRSCGCLQKEKAATRLLRHGHSRRCKTGPTKRSYSREYQAWMNMKYRVLNPKSKDYYLYGERGITICERWLHSFDNFYMDMGPCPNKLEIDRINTNGNYEPTNCRWTDEVTQARNRRPRRKGYHFKRKKVI